MLAARPRAVGETHAAAPAAASSSRTSNVARMSHDPSSSKSGGSSGRRPKRSGPRRSGGGGKGKSRPRRDKPRDDFDDGDAVEPADDASSAIPVEECLFSEFGLRDDLLAAIARAGYREPSPIQARAIPVALEGKDVIGRARTGTGKTCAFLVPALQMLSDDPGPRVLVICPTRELAMQCVREAKKLAHGRDLKIAAIYGGAPIETQRKALQDGAQILAGTPGRLLDFMGRGDLKPVGLDMMILDEADRMFDLGFRDDIAKIMKYAPKRRQTMLFSATLSDEVLDLSATYMNDPTQVFVSSDTATVDTVEQFFYPVAPNRKRSLLIEVLKRQTPERTIIFTRTKIGADKLAAKMRDVGFEAQEIHSDLPQSKRERILQGFRDGSFTYLIATDVAARGLDIPDVSHVVNYDIPQNAEDYVHRVGRTARMGKEGWAATFVCEDDGEWLTAIEKLINKEIEYARLEGFDHGVEPKKSEPVEDLQKKVAKQYTRTLHGYRRTKPRH